MGLPKIRGRVAFIFEQIDFDIDQIIGVKNIKLTDIDELAAVAMKSFDPDFRSKVRQGDILVGNANFGYAHPHYTSMRAMRHLGISAVMCESFSPGYWRGEISMGFPQIVCPGVLGLVERWDEVEIDLNRARATNITKGIGMQIEPLSPFDRAMLEAGGLIGYLKRPQVEAGAPVSDTPAN